MVLGGLEFRVKFGITLYWWNLLSHFHCVTKHITGLLGPSGPAIDFLRDLDLDSTEETRLWHNGEPGIRHLDFVSLGGARERME